MRWYLNGMKFLHELSEQDTGRGRVEDKEGGGAFELAKMEAMGSRVQSAWWQMITRGDDSSMSPQRSRTKDIFTPNMGLQKLDSY